VTDQTVEAVKIGRFFYLAEQPLISLQARIKRDAFGAGLFLGEQRKQFEPSLALLELLSQKTKKKAFVSEAAEWLFLCGRDVFENNIVKLEAKKGLVLVQNLKNENLGLGELSKKGNKAVIKNLLDRGDFLRRER
jgi:ribosome biogenesis protein Nip4